MQTHYKNATVVLNAYKKYNYNVLKSIVKKLLKTIVVITC